MYHFDVLLLLKALCVGFVISVPLGPSGVLFVRQTVLNGKIKGLSVGMGSAFAEAMCALAAVLGIQHLRIFHMWPQGVRCVGGLLLIGFGLKDLLRSNKSKAVNTGQEDHHSDLACLRLCAAGFLLIITNPLSFLAMTGFMGAFAMVPHGSWEIIGLGLGVFLGAFFWWVCVALGVSKLAHHVSSETLYRIQKWGAYFVVCTGIVLVILTALG